MVFDAEHDVKSELSGQPQFERDDTKHTGAPTLDELAAAIKGIRFALEPEQTFHPLETHPANPLEAPTGIEPVYTALQAAA